MKKELSARERVLLAGYSITRDVDTAYMLLRGEDKHTATDHNVHRMALRWIRGHLQQEYLQQLGRALCTNDEANRSKEDVVSELNVLASKVTDPKDRAAILMKLADLQNMKDEPTEPTEQEKVIHYYLPVRYPTNCKECLLYTNNVKSVKP